MNTLAKLLDSCWIPVWTQ